MDGEKRNQSKEGEILKEGYFLPSFFFKSHLKRHIEWEEQKKAN